MYSGAAKSTQTMCWCGVEWPQLSRDLFAADDDGPGCRGRRPPKQYGITWAASHVGLFLPRETESIAITTRFHALERRVLESTVGSIILRNFGKSKFELVPRDLWVGDFQPRKSVDMIRLGREQGWLVNDVNSLRTWAQINGAFFD